MIEYYSRNLAQTLTIAKNFSKILSEGDLVRFFGGLGAGKTSFIKGIAKGLGFPEDEVVSSSFIILREYKARFPIFHIDLYRLKSSQIPDEIYEVIFERKGLVLVEWPEKLEIERECFDIQIDFLSLSERRIKISSDYSALEKRLESLKK